MRPRPGDAPFLPPPPGCEPGQEDDALLDDAFLDAVFGRRESDARLLGEAGEAKGPAWGGFAVPEEVRAPARAWTAAPRYVFR